jgi:hypothetical protein
MSQQSLQEQFSLVIGDRLNWAFFLGTGYLKWLESIVREEGNLSEQQVREAVLALSDMCPTAWIDPQFQADVEKCFDSIEVDDRTEFCGYKVGKKKVHTELKINPHRLAHAVTDLLYRRNLLNKPVWTEVFTGRKYKGDIADVTAEPDV